MPTKIIEQAFLTPDSGLLKGKPSEWQNIQNFRGWGNRITRRRGVRNSQIFSSGVMGIHDLLVDDDPTSLDRVLITLNDGSLVFLSNDEIFASFTYLYTTGTLALQSPDLNWWNITPSSSGVIAPIVIATPSTTISSDLSINNNQLFGFQSSTVIYALYVNTIGTAEIKTYTLTGSENIVTTQQAFISGVGPVFQDTDLNRWRIQINNAGELVTTAI